MAKPRVAKPLVPAPLVVAPLVVLGDLMLDVDLVGRSDRLSPEAPVPVLHDLEKRRRPGGAALAALLLAQRVDRPVVLIAPLAEDSAAQQVRRLLAGQVRLIGLPWTGSTPVKTRIRAGNHPVARLDSGDLPGSIGPLPADAIAALAAAEAVLVSDYGRGASSAPQVRTALAAAARRVPVVWDPHPHGASPVGGTMLVTPNESELRIFAPEGTGGSLGSLRNGAQFLARDWGVQAVCVTLGARGAMLCLGENSPFMVVPDAVAAEDTCGAGDSFAAAATAALAAGCLPSEAVSAAVAAAAAFVAAGGAAGVHLDRVGIRLDGAEVRPDGVGIRLDGTEMHRDGTAARPGEPQTRATVGTARPAGDVHELLSAVRARGGTVVATGGCFDLVHAGHVAALQAARALGDCLVVCLNSDDSVRRLKGPSRPLQPAADRAQVLAALECVDAVVVFDEDVPAEVLRRVRPDIWAKGGDYSGVELPEAAVLAEWGGEAVTVPYLRGRSTTALVELATRPAARQ